ncbi:MAG: DUF302 domain-containing protein [Brooklawnia sp.]|uniref:DUF302 domain-containing protein n=1 Tax=Brooklawnia sp. TaxID=2699740 RepID=UPI003C7956DC
MSYSIAGTSSLSFGEAIQSTRDALSEQGFGVLTEIDMSATLKQKIDADILPYTILGACRPVFAEEALRIEPLIGLMLPCNIVVRELADSTIEISAIDPMSMVEMTGNSELTSIASDARTRLQQAVAAVTD